MKYSTLVILGLLLALAFAAEAKSKSKNKKNKQKQKEPVLPLAEPCRPENCKLPECRCSDATLPSSKFKGKENEIPQVTHRL